MLNTHSPPVAPHDAERRAENSHFSHETSSAGVDYDEKASRSSNRAECITYRICERHAKAIFGECADKPHKASVDIGHRCSAGARR